MIELKKTNENCSNVYLIDENECYADSLPKLTSNFMNLSANLKNLNLQIDSVDALYSTFTTISANIITTVLNVKSIYNQYISPYNTVQQLSANWVQPFSLFYPEILEINKWYATGKNSTAQQNTLKSWLQVNFPYKNFPSNQIVNIFVNIYEETKFYFEYNRSYFEDCRANSGGGVNVSCKGCGNNRSQGCNITGVGCRNAYDYCSADNATATAAYGCIGYGGSTMTIFWQKSATDRLISRVKKYKFKRDISGWIYQSPI
jgi:hypothetical protein